DRTKNKHQTCRRLKRCGDCKSKGRYITFAVYPIHYHMFFSSDYYETPDVVAVYSGLNCLPTDEPEEEIHTIMSYKNMTYSKETLVIITDFMEPDLKCSLSAVLEGRNDLLLETPIQKNPYHGLKDKIAPNYDNELFLFNDRLYMAAVRRADNDLQNSDSDETLTDYDLD
ncbi:unnamed protein product, partial [Meganyctiphanes norvegica]